ncbi:hypothetical protein ACFX1X_027186 [Malus domestica]
MWRLTEGSNEEEENGEDGKGRLDFDGLEARCGEIELRIRKSSRVQTLAIQSRYLPNESFRIRGPVGFRH